MRSIRLPSAPPKIRLNAKANNVSLACLRNNQIIETEATTAMVVNNQRCTPPASLRKLNAAPVLCNSVRSNTLSTVRLSKLTKCCVISSLLIWSSMITSALKPVQRLSIVAILASAEQITHAAAAQGRMLLIQTDIFTVMPAAFALVVQAG